MATKMKSVDLLPHTSNQPAAELVNQHEQLLHSINANIQVGIFRCDAQNRILYANQAFLAMFGVQSTEAVVYQPFTHWFASQEQHRETMIALFEKKRITDFDVQLTRTDGHAFWGSISLVLVQNGSADYCYDGVIRDITESKRSEEMQLEKNTELEKINSELDKFVYSASHELRAPLTSVLGLITIAKLDKPGETQLQYLTMMEQSINRLDKFINEIVYYSRNARLGLRKEQVDVPEMIREILEDLHYMEGVKQLQITPIITEEAPLFTDHSRLRVVLNNLISNAIKYHTLVQDQPFVRINVSLQPDKAVFTVEDNGRGIDANHVGKVFDMFFRASSDSKGSGLGLYIVKEIVTKLGGTILLQSELKKGSTFRVEIPNLGEE